MTLLRALVPALLLAALALVAAAPPASACTVPPPGYHHEVGPVSVSAYPPCPPAQSGGVEARVGPVGVAVPLPP